jgi:SAM-dependent methyltransferase
MSAARYFRQASLVNFFNDPKRLVLFKHILPEIEALRHCLKRPLNILDIGAGTGMHAAYLARMGHNVVAADPAENLLLISKERLKHVKLTFVVDALPELEKMKNCKFDVIYSLDVWQYVEPKDRQKAMERMVQLLKPGGVFMIVWPLPMSRPHQHPLSKEDILKSIESMNEKLPQDQRIEVLDRGLILDPDGRMGFKETKEKVYFHTVLAKLPSLQLQKNLSNESSSIRAKL